MVDGEAPGKVKGVQVPLSAGPPANPQGQRRSTLDRMRGSIRSSMRSSLRYNEDLASFIGTSKKYYLEPTKPVGDTSLVGENQGLNPKLQAIPDGQDAPAANNMQFFNPGAQQLHRGSFPRGSMRRSSQSISSQRFSRRLSTGISLETERPLRYWLFDVHWYTIACVEGYLLLYIIFILEIAARAKDVSDAFSPSKTGNVGYGTMHLIEMSTALGSLCILCWANFEISKLLLPFQMVGVLITIMVTTVKWVAMMESTGGGADVVGVAGSATGGAYSIVAIIFLVLLWAAFVGFKFIVIFSEINRELNLQWDDYYHGEQEIDQVE